MLKDKLEEASRNTNKKRVQVAIILFAAASTAALILLGVIKIDLSVFGLAPSATESGPSIGKIAGPVPIPAETEKLARRTPDEGRVDHPRIEQPEVPSVASEASQDHGLRDTFTRELANFESRVEPQILSEEFSGWNNDQQRQILSEKAEAISFFGRGEYERALTELRGASKSSLKRIAERDAAFNRSLTDAKLFFESDDYDSASMNIIEALRTYPKSPEALQLKNEIARLPEILGHIEKAAIARTENDLVKEKKYLKEVLKSDPSRLESRTRLELVETEIREQRFDQHIDSGLAYVGQRNLDAAKRELKNALSTIKNRPEAKLLTKKVATLALELEAERLISEAKSASDSDDWNSAKKLYGNAGKTLPNNIEVAEGLALSSKIVTLKEQLSRHLQTSYRLASPNVAKMVRNLISKAKTPSKKSLSLSKLASKLSELLDAYSKNVSVRVVSDGTTSIAVRGVGQVGVTSQKTIKLKPGRYTFEGTRAGYRSKFVQVDIPPGTESFVIEIYSDERI